MSLHFTGPNGVVRKRSTTSYLRAARADKPWVYIPNRGKRASFRTLKEAITFAGE